MEVVAGDEHLIRFAAHLALVLDRLESFERGEGRIGDCYTAQGNARNILLEVHMCIISAVAVFLASLEIHNYCVDA